MLGAVTDAFYGGVPQYLAGPAVALLTDEMLALLGKFEGIKK